MTVDELDKYLAYLPTRKTRSKQKTPTSTSSFYSTENKIQSKKYNGDLKGPRLPSKYNTYSDNRSQQTISFTSFDNDDNVSNGTIRSYQSEPDINNSNAQTTIIADPSNNNVYNNLINSMDNINIYDIENDKGGQSSSNPLHNSCSNYINGNNENDQTNREQQQTNGNMEYENKREQDISQSSIAAIRDDNQQVKNNNDNNRNYGYSSNKTQQYKENTYTSNNDKPPIPTFSFGSNNIATNKKNEIPSVPTFSFNNSTHSTNYMPPIPTFSFGDDNDQDDGVNDEISLDLSVSLRCGACDQLINGMAITAAGHRWHTECFKCYHCKQDLEHIAFYVKDQLPYCALDYHELFTTRCDYCHTPIEDKLISALGKNYHVGHLFCRECGKPFDEDSTFMEHDGHPYCEKDYLSKFAQKCKGCKEDITSEFIEALNGKWHLTCFVCVDCGKAFEDNTFYVRNDLPYCERHSLKLKKPL